MTAAVFVLLLFVACACAACSELAGNCSGCAAQFGCRFCALDSRCYSFGALSNPAGESITKPEYCVCKPALCKPDPGPLPIVCEWYTAGNLSEPPAKPADWRGGNFLPRQYSRAAACACSGGGSALWKLPAAQCVTNSLLAAHKALPDALKVAMRTATLSWNPIGTFKYVDLVYKMHKDAYTACCCSGTIAAKLAWYGIFFGGGLLPCRQGVIRTILQFSRCGCGW